VQRIVCTLDKESRHILIKLIWKKKLL